MELEFETTCHQEGLTCGALSPTGNGLAATAGRDRLICLWTGGQINASFTSQTSPECLSFSLDGKTLAFGTISGSIRLLDINSQKITASFSGHRGCVSVLKQSSTDVNIWASGSIDSTVRLWDPRVGKKNIAIFQEHSKSVKTLQFSPHGHWIATGADDCRIKLIDIGLQKAFGDISGHSGPLTDVKFHPSEYLLASGSQDKTVRFWDLETFECVSQSDPMTGAVSNILFDPSGHTLLSLNINDLRLCGWEPYHLFSTLPFPRPSDLDPKLPSTLNTLDLAVNSQNAAMILVQPIDGKIAVYNAKVGDLPPFCSIEQELKSIHFNTQPPPKETGTPFLQRSKLRRSFSEKIDDQTVFDDSPSSSSFTMSSSDNSPEHEVNVEPQFDIQDEEAFIARPKLNRSPPLTPVLPEVFVAPPEEDFKQTFVVHKVDQKAVTPTTGSGRKLPNSSPLMPRKSSLTKSPKSGSFGSKMNLKTSKSGTVIATVSPQVAGKKIEKVSPLPRLPVHDSACSQSTPDFGRTFTLKEPVTPFQISPADFLPSKSTTPLMPSVRLSSVQSTINENDCLKTLHKQSTSMQAVLDHRVNSVNVLRRTWKCQGVNKATKLVISMNDQSLVVELLNALNNKSNIWSLELCSQLLPHMGLLLDSKHDSYVQTAAQSLRLIMNGFGDVIKHGSQHMPSIGVDLTQEERTERCLRCYTELLSIRSLAAEKQKLGTKTGTKAQAYKEITLLTQLID